jgi:hypothetical protein
MLEPVISVVVLFATVGAAYRCMSEIRRLHSANTWGDFQVERVGNRAELRIPGSSWNAEIRDLVRRFGGQVQA